MGQIHKRSYWLTGFFVFLGILLSACQLSVEVPTKTPTEASTIPSASPTAIPPTETPIPATPTATSTSSFGVSPPPWLYIYENKLFERTGGEAPRLLADLPHAGEVLDARAVGDTVLVLREQGLQQVKLGDGSTDLLRFDVPAHSGALTADGTRVIYQQAQFGMGTHIVLYQVSTSKVQAVLSVGQDMDMLGMHVLGLTADGSGLYLLPRGQDPAFGHVLVAALKSGEIETELPIEGDPIASLAPNGRFIVTTMPQDTLNLYDLTMAPLKVHRLKLPNAPSHVRSLVWAPDGRLLYFSLLAGNFYDYEPDNPPAFYGLWRLDVESGTLSQVAAVAEIESQPVSISPDGQWLLLRYVRKGMWTDTATILHLPSGASESFALPAEAVVVGWC